MSRVIGTVKVITVMFLEEDIHDGDIGREAYDNARVEEFECDDIEEAVRVFTSRGLTFEATGTHWAANPDGSFIADYATGERHEVTAHPHGFGRKAMQAIVARVG